MPTGSIFVDVTLLRSKEHEAELAALLGHFAGHLIAHRESGPHFFNIRGTGQTAPATIPFVLGPGGLCWRYTSMRGAPLGIQSSAEQLETRADEVKLEVVDAAGYDTAQAKEGSIITTSDFHRMKELLPPAPRRRAPSLAKRGRSNRVLIRR